MGGRERFKLSALAIRKAGPGRMQDGGGLMLERSENGGSWVYRYSTDGKRREMGLGSYPDMSLADARASRDRWAATLEQGMDPLNERERLREAERSKAAQEDPTLRQAVEAVFKAIQTTLRDGGERGRWLSPLETHVLPTLGNRRLSRIGAADLRDVLRPIWTTKHPTAEKAVQRLGIVFRRGRLMGWPCDVFTLEQAKHMLAEVRHVPKHIPSTQWQDVPAIFARLCDRGRSHLCLRLLILTAVRATPARGLCFSEIKEDIWTVPAARMKGVQDKVTDFRVPLVPAALEVIREARETAQSDLAFTGITGNPVSMVALEKALRVLAPAGEPWGRPHGFRASFKDWTRETGLVSWEVAETTLSHKVGGTVERSYQRSDLLEQRRVALELWAAHVTSAV